MTREERDACYFLKRGRGLLFREKVAQKASNYIR